MNGELRAIGSWLADAYGGLTALISECILENDNAMFTMEHWGLTGFLHPFWARMPILSWMLCWTFAAHRSLLNDMLPAPAREIAANVSMNSISCWVLWCSGERRRDMGAKHCGMVVGEMGKWCLMIRWFNGKYMEVLRWIMKRWYQLWWSLQLHTGNPGNQILGVRGGRG